MTRGIRLYNGHLRGPVTLTPIPERLAVEPSLPVFTTKGLSGIEERAHIHAYHNFVINPFLFLCNVICA